MKKDRERYAKVIQKNEKMTNFKLHFRDVRARKTTP
jgi:hypothetical protein